MQPNSGNLFCFVNYYSQNSIVLICSRQKSLELHDLMLDKYGSGRGFHYLLLVWGICGICKVVVTETLIFLCFWCLLWLVVICAN